MDDRQRNKLNGSTHAIELVLDGVSVRVNDPEVALRLIELHKCAGGVVMTKQRKAGDFAGFWKDLNPEHKRLLMAIALAEDGVLTDDLAEKMVMDSREIPHKLRQIQSLARSHGLRLDDIFTRMTVNIRRKPKSKYIATAKLSDYVQAQEKIEQ